MIDVREGNAVAQSAVEMLDWIVKQCAKSEVRLHHNANINVNEMQVR